MDYQPINLKHIRTEVFKISQIQFAEVLNISVRTYQKYEEGDIPHKKINELRSLIAEYANTNNFKLDFSEVPSMEESKKTTLEEYGDLEIIEYLYKNLDRFSKYETFNYATGKREVLELKKKVNLLEEKLIKLQSK